MTPVYFCYLVFQLFSHKQLYEDDSTDIAKSTRYAPNVNIRIFSREKVTPNTVIPDSTTALSPTSISHRNDTYPPSTTTAGQDEERGVTEPEKEEKEEEEQPSMTLPLTIGLLVVVTAVSSFLSLSLYLLTPKYRLSLWQQNSLLTRLTVSRIAAQFPKNLSVSSFFPSWAMLPVCRISITQPEYVITHCHVSTEHATAVTVSVKDKLTLSLGVAVGSSIVSDNSLMLWKELTLVGNSLIANCPLCHSVSGYGYTHAWCFPNLFSVVSLSPLDGSLANRWLCCLILSSHSSCFFQV